LNLELNMALQGPIPVLPPSEPGVPGYAMWASWAGRKAGALNCHHGAPGHRIGGWQAVNLPPEKWQELHRIWTARGCGSRIPFYWCGQPNPRQKRVFCGLLRDDQGRWLVDHDVLSESALGEEVRKLNACLTELGLPPVASDVPAGVRWDSFDSKP
jgi:hypothetical protein